MGGRNLRYIQDVTRAHVAFESMVRLLVVAAYSDEALADDKRLAGKLADAMQAEYRRGCAGRRNRRLA